MSEFSFQRLNLPYKLLNILFNFLILWQSGCDFKFQIAAKLLPQAEVSSLNSVIYELKTRTSPITSSYCSRTVSNYGFSIQCTCDDKVDLTNCHVSTIAISGLGLVGTIDAAIGDLTQLTIINLSNNKLQGPIPDSLGNLPNLWTLDLSSNQLTGTIPDSIGNLISLRYLYLQFNFLDGAIPSSIGRLNNLTQLILNYNKLSGSIPEELGSLTSLWYLEIAENSLSGALPPVLGNLWNLWSLWLPSNYLSGVLPNSFANLTNLRWFGVAGNDLEGPLPDYVKKWQSIEVLLFQGNKFQGPVPADYFNLPSLEQLWISDLKSEYPFQLPQNAILPKIYRLVLRKCSIIGSIPNYIGDLSTLRMLDLSFNSLTGGIPESMRPNLIYLSLARNNLNGTIPNWIFQATRTRMDLSFNNFSKLDSPVPTGLDLNVFGCCCCEVSTTIKPHMLQPTEMMRSYFRGGKPKFYSLFINSGGEQTESNGTRYEADNSTSRFYVSSKQNWAYSFSGDFLQVTADSSDFTKRVPCKISNSHSDVSLYDDARLSPVSLTYYGFLRKGRYNVTLHFAEIVFVDEANYNILKKRQFDVYIQGKSELTDFDIAKSAGGPSNAISLTFLTEINDSNKVLDIHFYWAGQGSNDVPSFNGPLVSAISVNPLFKVGGGLSPLQIALITVASLVLAAMLLLALAWAMGWLESKELQEKIIIGDDEDEVDGKKKKKQVTLKALVKATENFSAVNKLGEGYWGEVYKAKVDSKITVAVKRLFPRHKGKMAKHINKETYYAKKLEGPNLVKLLDVHIGESLQLFVYEYMPKESLDKALFGAESKVKTLSWEERTRICLGIAEGLESLHKHSMRIVHGNIKCSNILLDESYKPKLSDFGMADAYSQEDQFSVIKLEASKGCLAPEYCEGNNPTKQTDIYSLGTVLIEIVAGKRNKQRVEIGERTDLVDEVRSRDRKDQIDTRRFVDERLDQKYDEKQALNILRLAAICTDTKSLRPKISEVLSVLCEKKTVDDIYRLVKNEDTSIAPSDDGKAKADTGSADYAAKDDGDTTKADASASTSMEITGPEFV